MNNQLTTHSYPENLDKSSWEFACEYFTKYIPHSLIVKVIEYIKKNNLQDTLIPGVTHYTLSIANKKSTKKNEVILVDSMDDERLKLKRNKDEKYMKMSDYSIRYYSPFVTLSEYVSMDEFEEKDLEAVLQKYLKMII